MSLSDARWECFLVVGPGGIECDATGLPWLFRTQELARGRADWLNSYESTDKYQVIPGSVSTDKPKEPKDD